MALPISPIPPISPLMGVVIPEKGYGMVRFYQNILDARRSAHITFHFYFDPWVKTGKQPFAWDYVPAKGALKYSIIRIVAARDVKIQQEIGFGARTRKVPFGTPLELVAGPKNPVFLVYRPQDDGLIPEPGDIIEPHRIIGEPHLVGPDPVRFKNIQLTTVQVTPYEHGVQIHHYKGGYEIDIHLKQPNKRAAFAYEIELPEDTRDAELLLTFSLKIVHSDNVEVKVRVHEAFINSVSVWVDNTGYTNAVPPQGSELSDTEFRFKQREFDEVVPDWRRLFVIIFFEIGISLIPIVGVLYDIGQFAYAYATGKNFWGDRVNRTQLVLMGAFTAISLGLATASAVKTIQAIATQRQWQRLLEADALAEIKRAADSGFIEAVGKIDAKTQTELVSLLQKFEAGEAQLKVLLEKLNDVVGKAYLQSVEQRLLRRVFNDEFSGFSHEKLSRAYNKYKSQPQFRTNPDRALDPASWAKRQTTGSARVALTEVLGDDYADIINRAIQTKKIPRKVTQAEISHYDKLAGRVEDYGTLRNEAAKLPGFGEVFEIDHVLEQRFWRNNPNLTSAFDEKGLGLAFVVPKNEAIANQIFRRFWGEKIRYVHTSITAMLKEFIPHGAEPLFTVQQIWDAHAFVLESLGAHSSIMSRMLKDVQFMAEELGQSFTPRITKAVDFLPDKGWPIVVKDPSSEVDWIIIKQL